MRGAVVAVLATLGAASAELSCPAADGWFEWAGGQAGSLAFHICAQHDDAASKMNFQMEAIGIQNDNDWVAVGLAPATASVGSFMSSRLDLMMVNRNGAYRRMSTAIGAEPRLFSGQNESYGISGFQGSVSASTLTASWSRAYEGTASGVQSLSCCFKSYSYWVVATGSCGGSCPATNPTFQQHSFTAKTWTEAANFETCPNFDRSRCAATSAPTAATVVAISTSMDTLCANKTGELVLPSPHENALKVCWEHKESLGMYQFHMQSTVGPEGWAAFGISQDKKMPNTEIYWVNTDPSNTFGAITMRYTKTDSGPGYAYPPTICELEDSCHYIQNLSVRRGCTTDGGAVTQFSFLRPVAKDQADPESAYHYDLSASNSYTFLAALNYNGNSKHQHKFASESTGSFATSGTYTLATSTFSSKAKIAHGIMMILAWVFFSPVATFTARFTKQVNPRWKWFKAHMYMQIAAVSLTVLAVIVVSTDENVEYDAIVENGCEDVDSMECSRTHVEIGMAAMALAVAQVIMGLCRKRISNQTPSTVTEEHPHGPRRWLYNIMHWTNGLGLLILTLINVAIGLSLSDGWVKKPAMSFLILAIVVGVICAVLAEFNRLPQRFDKEQFAYFESIVRHLYAIMFATALAASITLCTIVADSDDM